jgi:DNA-binding MarR family transcriptional regulator
MSTLICLPAHILDAPITPRAREVLMLLASQTSAQSPALWICQARIAARLRCSPVTVARAIQQLVRAKLMAETGQLHQGRYKFYHVRWSGEENIKAVSKKITKPIRKVVAPKITKPAAMPIEGVQLTLPPMAQEISPPLEKGVGGFFPGANVEPPPSAAPLNLTSQAFLKDSRIAYYAEIARKRHQESQRLHQSILTSLR